MAIFPILGKPIYSHTLIFWFFGTHFPRMSLAKPPRFLRLECELHLHCFQMAWSLLQTTASSTEATTMLFQRQANTPAKPTRKIKSHFELCSLLSCRRRTLWALFWAHVTQKITLDFACRWLHVSWRRTLCTSPCPQVPEENTMLKALTLHLLLAHVLLNKSLCTSGLCSNLSLLKKDTWISASLSSLWRKSVAEEGHFEQGSNLKVFAEDRHFDLCIVVQFVKKKRYWRRTLGASSNLTDLLKTITLFFASSSFLQRKNVAEGGHLDQGSNLKDLLKRDTLIFASSSCLWRKTLLKEDAWIDAPTSRLSWKRHWDQSNLILSKRTILGAKLLPHVELQTEAWS